MSVPGDRRATVPVIDDASRIRRIVEIAEELGATRLRDRALAFAERIRAERVYVACVGQVKRGKSSLLNALIGESLLPTGIVPVTAVPTIVRYGERHMMRLRYTTGGSENADISDISAFVDETRNPANVRGVETVELFAPSELLRNGLCLIDTPGLGSIIRGPSTLTKSLIPHIDAAIVVIGVDPPLSGEELELIVTAAATVQHVIVVLNKEDRFDVSERQEARSFAEEAIAARIKRPSGKILEISSTNRIAGRASTPDWRCLVADLQRLTSDERTTLVNDALARGARRLMDEALAELSEMSGAIYRPVADAEDRVDHLRSVIAGTAFDWLTLHFNIERWIVSARQSLNARRDRFLERAKETAAAEIAQSTRHSDLTRRSSFREYLFEQVETVADRELDAWAREEISAASDSEQQFAAKLIAEAGAALSEMAVLRVDASPGDEWASDSGEIELIPPDAGSFDPVLAAVKAQPATSALTLRQRLVEAFMSADRFRELAESEAICLFSQMLNEGSERIVVGLVKRLEAMGEQIEAQIRGTLDDTFDRAHRAVAAAREIRDAGAGAARRKMDALAAWRREVVALRDSRISRSTHFQ